jgi:uncharacterized protein YdgA (DUF945 family)
VTRGTRNSLIVVALLVIAYPAAAWLIGLAAEHAWQTRQQQIRDRYPYLELVKRDYHRGVYTSTEEVTYRLRGPLRRSLQALPNGGGADWSNFEVTARNTIHHGPLPRMRTFAPATIDTEIILPPKVHEKLAELFGNKAGLTIHTRLDWLGGSTTEVRSAAFEQRTADGAVLSSQGIEGTSKVGRDLKYWIANFNAPGLSLKSTRASMDLEKLQLQTNRQTAFEEVYVGPINLTLARLEIAQTTPQERKLSIQNISLDSHSSMQGEYLDMDARLNADSLQVQQLSATHLVYEFRASHIHGPSLSILGKSLQAAQAQTDGGAAYTEKVQEVLKTDGVEILLRDPVFEIPRIGFAMPEGELLVSLKVSMHGLTRDELNAPPMAQIGVFAKHLHASADLRIDTALLDKFLDSSGKGDTIAPRLQGLQHQGYLKLEGKALTTHLTYQDGQLQVNGLAFPAVAPPPQPPPH